MAAQAAVQGYPTLLDLAVELQVKILQELGLGDLTRCTRVCKVLRRLVTSHLALQYKMELERAGMIDGPAKVPLTAKLEKIRARNAAWNAGLPLRIVSEPRSDLDSFRAFPGGVFFRLESTGTDGDVWKLRRPAWPEDDTSGGLEFRSISLTNWESSTPVASWTPHMSPRAVNFEEELMVFVKEAFAPDGIPQCVIISLAENKIIDTSWQLQLVFSDLMTPIYDLVHFVDDLLAWSRITFHFLGGAELRVVNWKTGAIVWRSLWPTSGRCILLDSAHALVIDYRGLFVFKFDPSMSPLMSPDWATETSCLLHLEFPALEANVARTVLLRPHEPGSRYFRSDRPFFTEDPGMTVLAVSFSCIVSDGPAEELLLVIPLAQSIHARLRVSSLPQVHKQQQARTVPWSEWGPDGTRLLKLAQYASCITSWGSQVAISLGSRQLGPEYVVCIVDVRPHSREDSFGGVAEDVPVALGAPGSPIDASDTIVGLKSFAEAVTTRLPYRLTHIKPCFPEDPTVLQSVDMDESLTHEGMVFMASRSV